MTAVVIVGGVALIIRNDAPVSDQVSNNEGSSSQVSQSGQIISGSMADLIALNKDLRCTFQSNNEYSETSGEVFVSNNKVRGNFSVVVKALGQTPFQAFMIADGKDSFVWSSLMKDGFKTPIQKTEESSQNGVDYYQTLSYSCVPWEKDESFFIPPETIQFLPPRTQ